MILLCFFYRMDRGTELQLVSWKDNKVVVVLSNACGIDPMSNTERYSRKDRKRIRIQCPNAIKIYNSTMGGVDRSDQNVGAYRINIRGKKWYYPLFLHLLDLCVTNSFILLRLGKNAVGDGHSDMMTYRIHLASHMISYGLKYKAIPPSVSDDVRFDGFNHLVTSAPVNRCALCQKNSAYKCLRCQRNLHPKCFVQYHTR